jgi:thioredoxin-related protein
MKKIFLTIFILAAGFCANAQEIKWMSLDEALAAQKVTPKPIFMEVYTNWCGECKKMDKKTFKDTKLSAFIAENYYAVKFNAEGNDEVNYKGIKYTNPGFDTAKKQKEKNAAHGFTDFLKIKEYPSLVIFESHGEIANMISGFKSAQELLSEL